MTRDLTAGMQAEVVKAALTPILLFEGLFDSGALRFWTGLGVLNWGGYEWTGSGNLVQISDLAESQELKAVGATVTLSGIPSELISVALAEDYQGRQCNCYIGALDDAGRIIADPYLLFGGIADVMEISDSGETASIAVNIESRLIDLERAREHRYEHEDQQTIYDGDLGLEYVSSIQDVPIVWGRS